MKYYCKKSSIKSVVSEVKTKAGISQSTAMPFSDIASTIDSFVIPTQRGSPTEALTNSSRTYTIQRGVYTGGTVSVSAQSKTATLKASDSRVSPDSGKVLSSVIVPASNVYSVAEKTIPSPTRGATSITVSGLSFTPVGIILILTSASVGVAKPYIGGLSCVKSGNSWSVRGIAAGADEKYGVPITSASVSMTSTSITISNIVATEGSSTFAATFSSNKLSCFVWG